mmetsp:Transcript_14929/g.43485  ORF Transcript_14929/g.43485 Transcript_14929/m.43485 type:complete len:202 (+) Transcript_14929:1242-1847(+)
MEPLRHPVRRRERVRSGVRREVQRRNAAAAARRRLAFRRSAPGAPPGRRPRDVPPARRAHLQRGQPKPGQGSAAGGHGRLPALLPPRSDRLVQQFSVRRPGRFGSVLAVVPRRAGDTSASQCRRPVMWERVRLSFGKCTNTGPLASYFGASGCKPEGKMEWSHSGWYQESVGLRCLRIGISAAQLQHCCMRGQEKSWEWWR